MRTVFVISLANRWRISLTVNGISSPAAVGRCWRSCAAMTVEQRVGEHDQGRVAVPGAPFADLVLVQADLALAGLETLLDTPADAGHAHQRGQGDRRG